MAVIRPFNALRPPRDLVAQVASVPYDVVNTEEARALAVANPLSFLHVSRSEIDLPEGTAIYSDAVYRKADDNFRSLIKNCPFTEDETPSIYLYRLQMGDREQVGLVACCSIDDYDKNLIRKHERTRRDKEDDRTRHILVLKAQTGPVFLTYRGNESIDTMVLEATATEPLYDFRAEDEVGHTIWRLPDTVRFVHEFREVPFLYIADGHHRAASAARARSELKEQSFGHTGEEEYNFFLAVLFPSNQLTILAYNRIVRDLNGLSRDQFLERLARDFVLSKDAVPAPQNRGTWSMYLEGNWYGLRLSENEPGHADVVASLDVSLLQDRLLEPILGIKDVRADKRIDFVGGLRGTAALERLVNGGEAAVAFSLFPTTIEDLLKVSDSGGIMPPKSTWFEPKLRDGLLIHNI